MKSRLLTYTILPLLFSTIIVGSTESALAATCTAECVVDKTINSASCSKVTERSCAPSTEQCPGDDGTNPKFLEYVAFNLRRNLSGARDSSLPFNCTDTSGGRNPIATWNCYANCVPIPTASKRCNDICTSVNECSNSIGPNQQSCVDVRRRPDADPELRCRNSACEGESDCICNTESPDPVANTCSVRCRVPAMASQVTCSSTVNECNQGSVCFGGDNNTFSNDVKDALGGTVPGYCTLLPEQNNLVRNYVCTRPCVGEGQTGNPTYVPTCQINDPGICTLQSDGTILDKCCPGALAQRVEGGCQCIDSKTAVYGLFTTIGSIMLPVIIILGMFLIVLKGYGIMTSQGDPAKLQEAKEGLTSAIIGLIFVLLAASILRVIITALITGDANVFQN